MDSGKRLEASDSTESSGVSKSKGQSHEKVREIMA
jgi:hypothetical protein